MILRSSRRRRLDLLVVLALWLLIGALVLSRSASPQSLTQCVTNASAQGTVDVITTAALPCGSTTNILLLTTQGANLTSTPTLQPQGLAAQTITLANGAAVAPGDLGAAPGYVAMLTPNGSHWLLMNPATASTTGNIPSNCNGFVIGTGGLPLGCEAQGAGVATALALQAGTYGGVQPARELHSLAFGMVGDNSTDNSTNGPGNTSTIQAWINACEAAHLTTQCVLDNGAYVFSGTVSITTQLSIRGFGPIVSRFVEKNANQTGFEITTINPITLQDLSVYGPGGSTSGFAFHFNNSTGQNQHSYIRNVMCNNTFGCFDFERASYWRAESVDCLALTGQCFVVRNAANLDAGDSVIDRITCSYATESSTPSETCVYWGSSGGLRFTNSKMLLGYRGLWVNAELPGTTGTLLVENNSFEGQYQNAILVGQSTTGNNLERLGITGNEILLDVLGGNLSNVAIQVDGAAGFLLETTITGNNLVLNNSDSASSTETGVSLNHSNYYTFTGNLVRCHTTGSGTNGVIVGGGVDYFIHTGNLVQNCTTNTTNNATNSGSGF